MMLRQLKRDMSPRITGSGITVKSSQELDRMLDAGRVTGEVLAVLRQAVAPGMTTLELDTIAEREIRARGAIPAFKGYRGFPGTLCVSINEEIVHGIPGERKIADGDVIGLDLGAIVDGLYGDSAVTVSVGQVAEGIREQMETGKAALFAGIEQVRAGNRIGDVSYAVEQEVLRRGQYGIVREYVGHGIGRKLHEDPSVPNFGPSGRGPLPEAGHGDRDRTDDQFRGRRYERARGWMDRGNGRRRGVRSLRAHRHRYRGSPNHYDEGRLGGRPALIWRRKNQ